MKKTTIGNGFNERILETMNTLTERSAAKAKARDFIDNEKQFHLGFLPTEQSNPITATLEEDFKRSTQAGVQCLQRGDRQIPITMRHVFAGEKFATLVSSMVETLTAPKGRIVFSGCGATVALYPAYAEDAVPLPAEWKGAEAFSGAASLDANETNSH